MQAALELAQIRPELKLRNVPLYAVVHETHGAKEFAPFLEADDIYLDTEVSCDTFVIVDYRHSGDLLRRKQL